MAERGQAPETDIALLTSDTALLETLLLQAPHMLRLVGGPDLGYHLGQAEALSDCIRRRAVVASEHDQA